MINTLNSWANESRLLLWGVEDGLDMHAISGYAQAKNEGIGYVAVANRLVLSELIESVQWFIYGYTSSFNYSYWGQIHQGLYESAGAVTWKTICEAWLKNDFEGRAPTIAIIDRMRQILWDEPFNISWAARPEKQPL